MSTASRPFVDRPIGDLVAATSAARLAAARWEYSTPRLVRVGMNAVFESNDVVLRVGRPTAPAETAPRLARVLAAHGVRVPAPVRDEVAMVDDLAVSAWERIHPTSRSIDWIDVGRQVRRVHEIAPSEVPDGYPVPSPVDFPWWDFERLLDDVDDELDPAAERGLRAALDRHAEWRDLVVAEAVVCHGDVHPGNVVSAAEGPVILDWDLLCRASPWWDHGPLMTWTSVWGGEPGIYEAFADGYGANGRGEPAAQAAAELRLVAATLMRVRAGRTDPAARDEAERRLSTWRGEPGIVWRAQ